MDERNDGQRQGEEVGSGVSDGSETEKVLDGLVQLHFSDVEGSLHDLNAAEVAEVLQGLVEFTSQMAKAGLFGEGFPPVVRVRPPQRGSFTLEAVLQFAQGNPELATAMYGTAAGAVAMAIRTAARSLRGVTPSDFEHLDNGNVKVTWSNGSVEEMRPKVWKELSSQKKPTKRALRKLMAPLSDDVNSLEVRSAGTQEATEEVLKTEPEVVLERSDYRIAVTADPDPEDETEVFDVEAAMLSIDFRPGEKWRIETRQGSRRTERSAKMEDDEFQQALDDGRALRKSDILQLRIREVLSVKNGRSHRDWTIVKVVSQRRGSSDDDGEASPSQPPA